MDDRTQREISPDLTAAERDVAREQLDNFNLGFAPPANPREISCALHDATGRLIGACFGTTAWNRLHVNVLWDHEDHRGDGAGARLLADAETKARSAGCRYVTLHTFSFQARGFYERRGYRVIFAQKTFLRDTRNICCARISNRSQTKQDSLWTPNTSHWK